MLTFEWDAKKAASNFAKHGVAFSEASTAFGDQRSITVADRAHATAEERWILLGMTHRGRLVVVSHTDRDENLRLISAKLATKRERRDYA